MGDPQSQGEIGGQIGPDPKVSEAPAGLSLGASLAPIVLAIIAALALWWSQGQEQAEVWRTDALLASEHRLPLDRYYLILTQDGAPDEDALRAASLTIGREAPGLRVPLAAPPGEIGAWLDAHALYLLPVETHVALAARFEDKTMTRSVQELRARLSSPLFGLMGEEARRDPLGIRPLLDPYLGASERPYLSGARVTSTGDLMSVDGTRLMVELRSAQGPAATEEQLNELLKAQLEAQESPLEFRLIDPAQATAPPRPYPPYVWLAACGLLAFAFERRLLAPLLRLGLAGLACAAASLVAPTSAPFEAPYFALLFASCLWLTYPNASRSVSVIILGAALCPLLALPYPGWAPWASAWCLASALAAGLGLVCSRFVPAQREGSTTAAPLAHTSLTIVAALALSAGLIGGGYLVTVAQFTGVDTLGDAERRAEFKRDFFDPALVVRSRSYDTSQVRALARAAEDHHALRLVADELQLRLEGPGAYLLSQARLEARRDGLRELGLRARMQLLRNLLENEGFLPEAFSEFLDTSARLNELPDARAALDGNLGAWIESRSYVLEGEPARHEIETSLHFETPILPPPLQDSRGEALNMIGPPVASAADAERSRARIMLAIAIATWLASLLSFLGHRHLPTALLVAAVGAASALAGIAALHFEGLALDASLLPPLLVVMAVCQAETQSSIERVAHGLGTTNSEWLARLGPLLAVALLALVTPDPITHSWGLLVAVGIALGGFAAHVLSPRIAAALAPSPPPTDARSSKQPREGS